MLFMVIEKFKNQDGKAVYRKLSDSGRGLPDGLKFVSSYVSADLSRCFQLMEADHDAAQGPGAWRTVVARTFERVSQPHGYTVEDLRGITAPTLILIGDRDPWCTVEEGAAAYRALYDGELAVLPNTGHLITPEAVEATVEFFERRLAIPS